MHAQSGFAKPAVYVNYANGWEGSGAIYGYEEWRVEKLKDPKRRWDPEGMFSTYHPIPMVEDYCWRQSRIERTGYEVRSGVFIQGCSPVPCPAKGPGRRRHVCGVRIPSHVGGASGSGPGRQTHVVGRPECPAPIVTRHHSNHGFTDAHS